MARPALKKKVRRAAKKRGRAAPFDATLVLELGPRGARRARAVVDALSPEAGRDLPGADVKVRRARGGRAVEIDVRADSLRTLRASVNSYLRWAALALDVSALASPVEDE
jgi:tRNA threonylcarbamoyladenosine modification (KEOPS) complex  Pcc1 subunit